MAANCDSCAAERGLRHKCVKRRQLDFNSGAARCSASWQPFPMPDHHIPNNCQSDSTAALAARLINAHVGFKNASLLRRSNTWPLVVDHDRHPVTNHCNRDDNALAIGPELERVVQHIQHHLSEGVAFEFKFHFAFQSQLQGDRTRISRG